MFSFTVIMCTCVRECGEAHVWTWSEDNFLEQVLSFQLDMDSKEQTHATNLVLQCLCPMGHLTKLKKKYYVAL